MKAIIAGLLQLDERIDLPDNCRVRVAVEPLGDWRAGFQMGLSAWKQFCPRRPVKSTKGGMPMIVAA